MTTATSAEVWNHPMQIKGALITRGGSGEPSKSRVEIGAFGELPQMCDAGFALTVLCQSCAMTESTDRFFQQALLNVAIPSTDCKVERIHSNVAQQWVLLKSRLVIKG